MKNVYLLLAFLVTGSGTFAQSRAETVTIKTSIYCDHCSKCNSCGQRLEQAVYTEKGIRRVDIDEANKAVIVVFNPQKTNADRIRLAIAKSGFDADNMKGDPAAYTQLDDCCKKQ